MNADLERAHDLFSASASQILIDLRQAAGVEARRIPEARDAAARVKALAYVWFAASWERLVKEALLAVFAAVNAARVPRAGLRPCLLSVADNADYKALSVLSGQKEWDRRLSLLDGSRDAEIVVLTVDDLPYDGRTCRPVHFALFQRALGLSHHCFAGSLDRTALTDLADGRNDVAHGHVSPIAFGRAKRTAVVLKNVERLIDAADGFVIALDDYLAEERFRRPRP